MAFNVALEDENGIKIAFIGEPMGAPIARGVSKAVGSRFPWASSIDPYGDTTFNYLQAKRLRNEWAILIAEADDAAVKEVLEQIDGLLQRCASGTHLYVKFYGD